MCRECREDKEVSLGSQKSQGLKGRQRKDASRNRKLLIGLREALRWYLRK